MDEARAPRRDLLAYAAEVVGLAAAYVALGRLGLSIAPVSRFATLVWPPTGISLAALVVRGARLWPGVAIGALVINLWTGAPLPVACGIAAGNTLEAAGAAFALRQAAGFRSALGRFSDIVALTAVAAITSTTISATVGVTSLLFGGFVTAAQGLRTWLVWWTGDLVGDLVVAPVLLTWSGPRRSEQRIAEAAALGALLVALALLVFWWPPAVVLRHHLLQPYVLFVPLIWAAIRFGPRGAATAVLVVAAAAVAGTYAGRGPYARGGDPTEDLIGLQVFLVVAAIASLVLAAVVCECDRSERELRDREALLRAILDGATDAIFVKDRDSRYLVMNAATARLVGQAAEATVGKDDSAFFSPEEARALRAIDVEVMRSGVPQAYEEHLTIAGQPRVYHSTKAPYRDGAGRVLGVIGISRDMTDRKNVELARAWLAAIVESSVDAIVGMTLDGTITSWNAAAERLYGYTPDEAIGQPIRMLVPEDRREELADMMDRIQRGELIAMCETVRRRKDGRTIDVALTRSPIHDGSGAVIGAATIARDVTDTAERQRIAVEAAQLGLWFWNVKIDRIVWTPMCRAMYGVGDDEELSYARFLATLHPEDRDRTRASIAASIAGRPDVRLEYRVVWPDGSVHWLSVLGRTFYDEAGAADRMLGTTRDVTAQKEAEAERAALLAREQEARAEAQAATRAKDEFLAVVSHELRTPLQAMIGWTDLLVARSYEDPTLRKGLAAITRSAQTQMRLIGDLLDVSRIVAGKLRIELTRLDLGGVVEAAAEAARPAAEAKSVAIEATVEPLGGAVLGDPVRLQQVVSNLLTNALKFTPSGGRVAVRLARDGDVARLSVEDSGRGISADFLPYVFDRFSQADSAGSRAHGGLGLGLAIVRHIVELHGGAVQAESAGKGHGATFTVTLPIAAAPSAAAMEAGELPHGAALGGVRVLVVDDDPDARELVGTVLHASGADVHAVESASAALVELETFGADLLLSDIAMPGDDGYALIRAVRAREAAGGGHMPAVALTAFASSHDREQALAVGFDAHLPKPASPHDLTSTVARLARRAAAARA